MCKVRTGKSEVQLETEKYTEQCECWPQAGRHILAQFDAESVVVYQAYCPAIGSFAAANGYFGGEFSLNRMSWIKPNFLWMMYRSGWGTKPGQEVVLALRLKRIVFDEILAQAVPSSFAVEINGSREEWRAQIKKPDVRLQWDPDHGPSGDKKERRAIQLGVRREVLRSYAREWLIYVEDISNFVAEQRNNIYNTSDLVTPREDTYPVSDPDTRFRLGIDQTSSRG